MDAAPWPQGLQDINNNKVVKGMEEVSSNTCTRPVIERKARPQEQLNCPRCNSTNTKFCYYNNYSLTQPRYFCKTCRRYWTEGGSLRNVPVGGGSRKNKRSSISSSSSSTTTSSSCSASSSNNNKLIPDLNPPSLSQLIPKNHEGQDLNLTFPAIQENHHHHHQNMSHFLEVAKNENSNNSNNQHNSALELLRTGIASRGLNSFIPTPMPPADSNALYNCGFPMQEFKPSLSFSVQENGGRVLFPFGELKQLSTSTTEVVDHHHHQNKGQGATTNSNSNGYWNGMFGGNGGSW